MGKDVIDDQYARLYEIPRQLAKLGHDVLTMCIGYQGQGDGEWEHEAAPGRLRFLSRSISRPWLPRLLTYPRWALRQSELFAPDLVIGASDIPNVVLARWLARRLHAPLVIDLYDNFEAFGQGRIPGMVTALRCATRHASLVTTTSEALAHLVRQEYRATGLVLSMPSTIDKSVFRPLDRQQSRNELGLPADAILIGTAGGLHKTKGIEELYGAWRILESDDRIHLVLAGPQDGSTPMPTGDRVHYLSQLPHEKVAVFFNALDVAAVCVLDTPFGRFCFPQKAYEILATGTPLIASNVGAMKDLFVGYPELLYTPGSPASLAERIQQAISSPARTDIPIDDWATLVKRIEPALRRITGACE